MITGDAQPSLAAFDAMLTDFVKTHAAPGAALAITHQSRLVYARGFGLAEVETKRPVQPNSIFRIASISKPLTAVAMLQLVEQGKVSLSDKAFDILPHLLPKSGPADARLKDITVQHLLQHTAGWDRAVSFDPIVRAVEISKEFNVLLPVGPEYVIRYMTARMLDFAPGARYAYANVDYLILGRLIEHFSGQTYVDYVQEHLLQPLGISKMRLGRAARGELVDGEVCYYDSEHRSGPAICGRDLGQQVPEVYGAENFEAYEAHGGWIASAVDLVRFASAFDHPEKSPLLKPETIALMTKRPEGEAGLETDGKPRDVFYGCGWSVRTVEGGQNVWHNGLIPGTSTILLRRFDGLNMAVLFNTDHNAKKQVLSREVDPLLHQTVRMVKDWPAHDLFGSLL